MLFGPCSASPRTSTVSRTHARLRLRSVRSVQCESKYALQTSGGAIRRALFKVERGVCVRCKADCRGLVQRLQAVEKGSRGWEARRRTLIAEYAPRCVLAPGVHCRIVVMSILLLLPRSSF